MSEPFIGQIQPFGFNFPPRGWAECNGQLLSIAQNTALFSLLGTTYGGNGETTFGLPDLRGRAALHNGQGLGLTNRSIGQRSGSENEVLNTNQIPAHNHPAVCNPGPGDSNEAQGKFWAKDAGVQSATYNSAGGGAMNAAAIGNTGGSLGHNNMQPYLVINWCIALIGLFPSES